MGKILESVDWVVQHLWVGSVVVVVGALIGIWYFASMVSFLNGLMWLGGTLAAGFAVTMLCAVGDVIGDVLWNKFKG